jgi:ribosomal protein S18 acetylase RimI-like enzyme
MDSSPGNIALRDTANVDTVQLEALRRSVGWDPLDPEVLQRQLQGSRWTVSAWDDERLVGFVRAISDGVTNAYVCTFVVDAEYRNRGIGSAMLERLVAGKDGVRWVLHAQPAAKPLYARHGFKPAVDMMRRDRA